MGPDTHLNQRITKLMLKGLSDKQIARKIGRDTEAGLRRVRKVTKQQCNNREETK
jgi:DNA-binding CsgD family transcriptional regulator